LFFQPVSGIRESERESKRVCVGKCVYMTFLAVAASVAQLEQYFAGQSTGNWPRGELTVLAMKRSFT